MVVFKTEESKYVLPSIVVDRRACIHRTLRNKMPTTRLRVPVGEQGQKVAVNCENFQAQRIIKLMSEGKCFPNREALTNFVSFGAIPNGMISVTKVEMTLSK